MPRGDLHIVSAPSGAGKTSLTRALIPRLAEQGIRAEISVSYTTRAPRPGELDGVHYHFISEAAFQAMIAHDEFFEHAEVFGRRYGTGHAKTEALLAAGTHVILDIDWQGGRQVRQKAPQARSLFILPPSLAELERRLRDRGQDSDAVIATRMAQAQAEISHCHEFDRVLVNQDFERALSEVVGIFTGTTPIQAPTQPRLQALIGQLLAKQGSVR
jgi:guanylate kinase